MCGLLLIQITYYERNIKNSSFLGLFVTDTNSEWVKPRAEVQTQENGPVATGREGEGGINWESRIDIYTLLRVKQIASGNLLSNTGISAPCSVMAWGWGVQRWEGGCIY